MRLILHIGAGKTGTSSIQTTLRKNQELLNKQGFKFLGLMCEFAYKKEYIWQKSSQSQVFHKLDIKEAITQTLDILENEFNEAKKRDINSLIWSNESFFDQNQTIIEIAKELKNRNIEIEIIAYIREYNSWIQSAYFQWGIKHKTYKNKILPFSIWSKRKHNISFAKQIKQYSLIFNKKVTIRNFETKKDVVEDFLGLLNINQKDFKVIQTNEKLTNEELFLRAMFNDYIEDKALPTIFEETLLKIKNNLTPKEYLSSLFADKNNLEEINIKVKEDREELNNLLLKQNEKALLEKDIKLKDSNINNEKLLMHLTQIVIEQSLKIKELEKRIDNE